MPEQDDEICLGPPCRHFPATVKTAEDAREYLAYRVLTLTTAVNYINGRKEHAEHSEA